MGKSAMALKPIAQRRYLFRRSRPTPSHEAPGAAPDGSTIGVDLQAIPRRGARRRWCVAVVLAAAVVTSAACGSEPDPWLEALKQDPLATTVPPGGELVLDIETKERRLDGKPVPARILRAFAYPDAESAARGRAALIDAARASGWELYPRTANPDDPVWGAKVLPIGGATLTLGYASTGARPRVSVQITQGSCPPQLCRRR
jgi:hypothetical protein